MSLQLPAVRASTDSAPFFDAWQRGELLIRRCAGCAAAYGPEARTCARCGGVALEPTVANGHGQLVSWAVVHQAPIPRLAAAVPYVVGVVQLAEGPWLLTRLIEVDQDALAVGMAVRVDFVRSGTPDAEGDDVPVFGPA